MTHVWDFQTVADTPTRVCRVSLRTTRSNQLELLLSRNWPFVAAHMTKINHADCGSSMAGIRSNSKACSSDFCSKNAQTNPGCPTGIPKIFTPCCASGNLVSPLQTIAPRFTSWAALVNASTPLGVTPPRFHTCVFPFCLIWVWAKYLLLKDPPVNFPHPLRNTRHVHIVQEGRKGVA